jgi:hypothetical protein
VNGPHRVALQDDIECARPATCRDGERFPADGVVNAILMAPEPVPDEPLGRLNQDALEVTVHGQLASVVMVAIGLPPAMHVGTRRCQRVLAPAEVAPTAEP